MVSTVKLRMSSRFKLSVLAFVYALVARTFALEKPDGLSDEMYCLGCQVTVKELDFMLSKKPTRGMGETVTRALKRVCDIHNFHKYDVDSEKALKVCNHIKGDEGMEAVLITEYGRKHATGKKTTYLDMTNMICGTVLKACYATETIQTDDQNEDGGITFDPETEDFQIKFGKKVRTPNPVAESDPSSKTESIQDRKTESRPDSADEGLSFGIQEAEVENKSDSVTDSKPGSAREQAGMGGDETVIKTSGDDTEVRVDEEGADIEVTVSDAVIENQDEESHDEL